MEAVRDTPFEHGVLCWPLEPPLASMLVVVKATYTIGAGGLSLTQPQPPCSGERYWDDDPTRSVRTPGDFAVLKPRGECFVVGHCRPLTGRPEPQTVAAFQIGPVKKSLAVYGDRTWEGDQPGRPVPFTEMPLSWERAYGGPSVEANPLGRPLPNLELEGDPVTSTDSRPRPACSTALGMTWKARMQYAGTYDDRWRATRFPWLPVDFRFAFYNEAPADQQIDGYWRGDEVVALRNLHPTLSRAEVRLPRILPRVFIEHDETSPTPDAFEEIALVLDTLLVDADEGTVSCVWRGRRQLATDALEPRGIRRLFTMHEDLSAEGARAATLETCRARMVARLEAIAAERAALQGVAPPVAPPDATVADGGEEVVAAARAAAEKVLAGKRTAESVDIQAKVDGLKRQLAAAGIDLAAIDAKNLAELPAPELPTRDKIVETLAKAGGELSEAELDGLMAVVAAQEEEWVPPAAPPPPPDLREIVIDLHRRSAPVTGDFTSVNLAGLDLRGLDARGAILMGANFRGTNLMGAKLDDATLLQADFLSANLTRASLRRADLQDAVLEAAQLVGARLDRANLSRAELQSAVLDDAQLVGADLTGAQLEGASLVGAKCDGAVFNQAQMGGCKLTGASLVETRLYGAMGEGVSLDRADLTKVRVGRGADLSRASVRGAKAKGSNWRDAKLTSAVFSGTNLTGADFTRADLEAAQLGGCRMRGAVLQEGKLVDASLSGADLYEGNLAGSELTRADLSRANLYSANFYKAYGDGVRTEGANVDGTYWEKKK